MDSKQNQDSPLDEILEKAQVWPIKCICSLCECGVHKCSTFELDRIRKKRDLRKSLDIEQVDQEQIPKMDDHEHQLKDSKFISISRSPCTDCSSSERYVVSPSKTNRQLNDSKAQMFRSKSTNFEGYSDEEGDENDESIHVLALKPKLAPRPKDNILFEGDMDLKTTFEASYEALARMRLDNWREYQQSIQRQRHGRNANERRLRDDNVSPSEVSYGRATDMQLTSSVHRNMSETRETPEHELKDVSVIKEKSNLRGPRGERKPRTLNRALDGEHYSQQENSPISPQLEKESNRSQPTDNHLIDPDPSPLIVYDANMNRLETVRRRKRSKYRPSTSLRTGARGLFGDTPLEPSEKQRGVVISEQAHGLEDKVDGSKATSKFEDADCRNRSQIVRNLEISKRDDRLTFSDQNLPIDAKRKSPHIFEQSRSPIGDDLRENLVYNSNIRELALEEERAANEEVESVMSKHNDKAINQSDKLQTPEGKLYRTCQNQNFDIFSGQYPEPKEIDDSSKTYQSRLSPEARRFYKNLFHESPDFILTTGPNLYDSSRSPIYKAKSPNKMGGYVASDDGKKVDNVGTKNYTNSHQGCTQSPDSGNSRLCRCTNLNDNYQFVGSKSGHKFFIEKLFEE